MKQPNVRGYFDTFSSISRMIYAPGEFWLFLESRASFLAHWAGCIRGLLPLTLHKWLYQ
jgi:hypothetical protein